MRRTPRPHPSALALALLSTALLLSLLPRAALAQEPPAERPDARVDARLGTRIARFRAQETQRRERDWYQPPLALDALWRITESHPGDPVAAFAGQLGLSPEAARPLLEAALAYSSFERYEEEQGTRPTPEACTQTETALIAAFEATAGHRAAQQLLVKASGDLDLTEEGTVAFAADIASAVGRMPDAGRVAYELGTELPHAPSARLLELAFARLGEHPALLDTVARRTSELDVQAGAYGLAVSRLLSAPDTSEDVLAYFAQQWLRALLEAGLVSEARAALATLPPAIRARLAAGMGSSGSLTVGDLEVEASGWNLAPALVAAALLTGHDAEARERLAAVPAADLRLPSETRPEDYHEAEIWAAQSTTALVWRLLTRLAVPGSTSDPFDDLTREISSGEEGGSSPGFGGQTTLRRAFALLAEREGYPEIAAYERHQVLWSTGLSLERQGRTGSPYDSLPELPPVVAARVTEGARQMEALHSEVAGRLPDSAPTTRDTAARTLARSLAAPRLQPYEERALPAGIHPIDPQSANGEADVSPAPLALPGGLHPVRIERQGNEVVAVAASQDYDPVGEVSSGGYWVVRSHDGGETWSHPLYTGLRVFSPYVVRPASELPLLGGGTVLNLEVEILELDEDTVTLPPVALQSRRREQGLYLVLPLAELEKDSDGDGLTDLAEERLLTDPKDPDTDGDGIGDAADPLPQVAYAGKDGAEGERRARALETVLAKTAGERWRALVVGPPGPSPSPCCPDRPTLTDEATLFLVGERADFADLSPGRRVIVLTPEEEKAAAAKFGLLFPLEIRLLTFDRTGDHALVIWTSHWQGGTFRLDWKDGAWVAEEVSRWIT